MEVNECWYQNILLIQSHEPQSSFYRSLLGWKTQLLSFRDMFQAQEVFYFETLCRLVWCGWGFTKFRKRNLRHWLLLRTKLNTTKVTRCCFVIWENRLLKRLLFYWCDSLLSGVQGNVSAPEWRNCEFWVSITRLVFVFLELQFTHWTSLNWPVIPDQCVFNKRLESMR